MRLVETFSKKKGTSPQAQKWFWFLELLFVSSQEELPNIDILGLFENMFVKMWLWNGLAQKKKNQTNQQNRQPPHSKQFFFPSYEMK